MKLAAYKEMQRKAMGEFIRTELVFNNWVLSATAERLGVGLGSLHATIKFVGLMEEYHEHRKLGRPVGVKPAKKKKVSAKRK